MPLARLLVEKAPLFALSGISCIVTLYAQRAGGAVGTLAAYPISLRAANAAVSAATYLARMVWPAGLAVFYPYPAAGIAASKVALAVGLLGALTALTIASVRSAPWLTVGWFWYLVTLAPVVGIVQVGRQALADRYTYIPLIGPFIMIAWGVPALLERSRRAGRRSGVERSGSSSPAAPSGADRVESSTPTMRTGRRTVIDRSGSSSPATASGADRMEPSSPAMRAGVAAAALAVLAALAIAAHAQAGHFRTSVTLFQRAIDVTEANAVAHNNLGSALQSRGDLAGAAPHYKEAVRIDPLYGDARANLGGILIHRGDAAGAIAQCREALRIEPGNVFAHANLGTAFLMTDRLAEAEQELLAALRIRPEHIEARLNLGVVKARQSRMDQAIAAFQEVLRLSPGDAEARRNLDQALADARGPDGGSPR